MYNVLLFYCNLFYQNALLDDKLCENYPSDIQNKQFINIIYILFNQYG